MDEIERDDRITIDVAFGNLTFCKEGDETYVRVTADLTIDAAADDKLDIDLKVPVAPEADTVLVIVERCRARIAKILRSGSELFDGKAAEDLLYAASAIGQASEE